MFEYKPASFYTEYFRNTNDFSVVQEFDDSTDKDEKNLYVGYIEVLNTIHPLTLRVEIPHTFPHNKLTFRTKSISGYPHLIHSGKVQYGDWFCLNTPFAETAEEQLNQEVRRLKEWITRQMRNDLPATIDDLNVKLALAIANAYEWENPDEVKEFCSQALLTFVGNFQNDIEHFHNNIGHLECIKSPDNRFYALSNRVSNYRLPYIIVEETPTSRDILSDFIKLRGYYNWGDDICKHLLPEFDISESWVKSDTQPLALSRVEYSQDEALKIIGDIETELQKEESYLFNTLLFSLNQKDKKRIKVLHDQKEILLSEISELKKDIQASPIYVPNYGFGTYDLDKMSDDELLERQAYEEYAIAIHPYEWHHFALGVKSLDGITWYILYTNHNLQKSQTIYFDIGLKSVELKRVISHELNFLEVQSISEDMYYGRGSFSSNFKAKKIAIVGLGAIGSMVASALARTGISELGLWDNDIVEPGNICRSSYTLNDLGESKVESIRSIIRSINPYIKARQIKTHGQWVKHSVNFKEYVGGSFYNNVNYNSQEKAIQEIAGYDMIIDCTGSNEMLHFLSYALPGTDIVSLCITNRANDLLCITSRNGKPFELRKAYLSRIEQDTKNFYIEGQGCYSPTFLANNCDIAALVNLALRDINLNLENGYLMQSSIYSYTKRGILTDKLSTYKLNGYDITLTIPSEAIYDAEDMDDAPDGDIGYILGCYSQDGKQIMVTHIVDSRNATELLTDAYKTSKGIIDYIGDYRYSGEKADTYSDTSYEIIEAKAYDESINTNNPLLAVRNPDYSVSFFLYINNELVKFELIS
ncbi:MAG: ThiF family adenylyltransferase [Alistipes sp.]|nr:ThiF family adenylyltransferase [Alistipes sp.]